MGQRFLMILIHLEEVLVHFHLSRGLSLLCRECLCLCLDLWAGLGSMELEVDIVHPAVAGEAGGANRFWEPFESAVAFAGMEAVAAAFADLAWGDALAVGGAGAAVGLAVELLPRHLVPAMLGLEAQRRTPMIFCILVGPSKKRIPLSIVDCLLSIAAFAIDCWRSHIVPS